MLDGMAVVKYNLQWYRTQIALVPQHPALLAKSIRDNITYPSIKVYKCDTKKERSVEEITFTDDQVEQAARKANAHDFIAALPQGYNTQCADGANGINVSESQKQRIALARAFLTVGIKFLCLPHTCLPVLRIPA